MCRDCENFIKIANGKIQCKVRDEEFIYITLCKYYKKDEGGLNMIDTDEIIKYAEHLLDSYKTSYNSHVEQGSPNMANSVKGSIIGIVALLSHFSDKSAEDYFREIFPEEWDVKE